MVGEVARCLEWCSCGNQCQEAPKHGDPWYHRCADCRLKEHKQNVQREILDYVAYAEGVRKLIDDLKSNTTIQRHIYWAQYHGLRQTAVDVFLLNLEYPVIDFRKSEWDDVVSEIYRDLKKSGGDLGSLIETYVAEERYKEGTELCTMS